MIKLSKIIRNSISINIFGIDPTKNIYNQPTKIIIKKLFC